VTLMT